MHIFSSFFFFFLMELVVVLCIAHLHCLAVQAYCLAVQADFYGNIIECLLHMWRVAGSIFSRGKTVIGIFSPVTSGAQRT